MYLRHSSLGEFIFTWKGHQAAEVWNLVAPPKPVRFVLKFLQERFSSLFLLCKLGFQARSAHSAQVFPYAHAAIWSWFGHTSAERLAKLSLRSKFTSLPCCLASWEEMDFRSANWLNPFQKNNHHRSKVYLGSSNITWVSVMLCLDIMHTKTTLLEILAHVSWLENRLGIQYWLQKMETSKDFNLKRPFWRIE